MSNPQITGRTRMGLTEGLRAVFTGIGRILMAADQSQDQPRDPDASRNGQARDRGPSSAHRGRGRSDRRTAATTASASTRWRSLDQTGNVRLLSADDLDDGSERATPAHAEVAAEPASPLARATATPAAAESAGFEAAAAPAGVEAAAAPAVQVAETDVPGQAGLGGESAALPLAGYATLSLASIRARLRGLDSGQLRVLADYERIRADRPEVLGMLERRIEKLGTGG